MALRRLLILPVVLPFLALGAEPTVASPEAAPAEPAPLKVRASDPELKKLRAATTRLLGDFLIPCAMRLAELKVPEDQIEQRCGCESAPAVNATIATFEAVLRARPTWRGKALQFKDADGSENTLRIDVPDKLKARLATCEGAGTALQSPFAPSDLLGTWGGCFRDEADEGICLTVEVPAKGAPTNNCTEPPLKVKSFTVDPLGAATLVVNVTDRGEKLTFTFKGTMNAARDAIAWRGRDIVGAKPSERETESLRGVHAKGKTEPCK